MNSLIKKYKDSFFLLEEVTVYFYGLILNRHSPKNIENELISYLVAKTSSEFILSGAVNLKIECYDLEFQPKQEIKNTSIVLLQLSIEIEKGKRIYCHKTVLIAQNSKEENSSQITKFKQEYNKLQNDFKTLKQKMEQVYLLEKEIDLSFLSFESSHSFVFLIYDNKNNIYGNYWQQENKQEIEKKSLKEEKIILAPQNIYQFFFFSPNQKISFSCHFITDEYKIDFLDKQSDLLIF